MDNGPVILRILIDLNWQKRRLRETDPMQLTLHHFLVILGCKMEFIFCWAVPFPKDVLQLKQLGVGAVITLNEPYFSIKLPASTDIWKAPNCGSGSSRVGFLEVIPEIEELDEVESDGRSYNHSDDHVSGRMIVRVGAKRALVGAGARILFYPTLLYNVFRNKIQAEFRWWDQIDQYLLLGAVPFPKDVLQLKQLGVGAVITLNEPYCWFQHHCTM
ncbi:hypothetical protein TEA_007109 [Camellia sinensis var. sinensis]|uniref:Uncharacterized protein n=1 Tax=Camellia sinensis var. sinensis TaxID=542762 RepID=A0A4S4EDT3_CAMSN|nr:hypothetical protein TEA_007109 [Camellia sinensis var. sinensis]